jgi:hypothetical protein
MRKKFIWKPWELPHVNILKQGSIDDDIDIEDENDDIFDVSGDTGIKMFILHTNFIITFDIIESIIKRKIPGIEVLKPLTSYKLLVGVPESGFFNAEEIKKIIEESFLISDYNTNYMFDEIVLYKFGEEIANSAIEIRNGLYNSQDYWILYIYPNGQFEIITDITKTSYFIDMLENLNLLFTMIGGVLISSIDYENNDE